MKNLKLFCLTVLLSIVASANALVTLAYDDASDAAYTGGNVNGLNGGYGFSFWSSSPTSNTGNAGNFQFTSSQNGSGASGNIDTAGLSWGLYANSGQSSSIHRGFNIPMVGYRKISLEFDNGWLDNGAEAFVKIGTYEFGFTGGQSTYWFDKGLGRSSTGLAFTADGLEITLELFANGNYLFSAKDKVSTSTYFNANTGGVMPANISTTNFNAGGGANFNSYINKMKVEAVPEPGTAVAMIAGLGMILARRKK